jgi:hypothetical protein
MEDEPPIRLTQEIKSKMSSLVFHLLVNSLKTSTTKKAFNVLSWDIKCMSKFGFMIGDIKGNKMVGSISWE